MRHHSLELPSILDIGLPRIFAPAVKLHGGFEFLVEGQIVQSTRANDQNASLIQTGGGDPKRGSTFSAEMTLGIAARVALTREDLGGPS